MPLQLGRITWWDAKGVTQQEAAAAANYNARYLFVPRLAVIMMGHLHGLKLLAALPLCGLMHCSRGLCSLAQGCLFGQGIGELVDLGIQLLHFVLLLDEAEERSKGWGKGGGGGGGGGEGRGGGRGGGGRGGEREGEGEGEWEGGTASEG